MNYFKRSLIALIVAIIVFFNFERLGFVTRVSAIDLLPFVYAFGTIVVVLTLLVPPLRQASVWFTLILWTAIYFWIKTTILTDPAHPITSNLYIYATLIEIAWIDLLGILARTVARDLHDWEQAVENITIGDPGRRVQSLENATEEIETELIRSRRHHRPLAVIVVKPHKDSLSAVLYSAIQRIQQTMASRYLFASLGQLITTTVRRTDFVFADPEKDRFIVLCPETDFTGSIDLVDRINAIASVKMGVAVSCGIGTFPDEALTFDELVRQAELHRDTAPTQSARASLIASDAT